MRTLSFKLLMIVCLVFGISASRAQSAHDDRMLSRATPYFAQLSEAIATTWTDLPAGFRTVFPAQVEQESLWVPTAELCVPKPTCSREHGVGFGQFTVTPRFNVFEEVKLMDSRLRDWKWADRHNPRMQFIAIVVKDRNLFRVCRPLMSNDWGGFACTMSSYNGGYGGFTSDRRLCGNTAGCNPRIWTGHIEKTSLKMKAKVQGYGKSFFEINREYVDYTLRTRRAKYEGRL